MKYFGSGRGWPHPANDLESIGDVLQLLRDIFTELAQLTASVRIRVTVKGVIDNLA
ncbi:MAG: hypothetical protein ABSE46_10105 [Terracidiphilus sp.]